jgi:hypothetical protein
MPWRQRTIPLRFVLFSICPRFARIPMTLITNYRFAKHGVDFVQALGLDDGQGKFSGIQTVRGGS